MAPKKTAFKMEQLKSIFKLIFVAEFADYRKHIRDIKSFMVSSRCIQYEGWFEFFSKAPFDQLPNDVRELCAQRAMTTSMVYLGHLAPANDKNLRRMYNVGYYGKNNGDACVHHLPTSAPNTNVHGSEDTVSDQNEKDNTVSLSVSPQISKLKDPCPIIQARESVKVCSSNNEYVTSHSLDVANNQNNTVSLSVIDNQKKIGDSIKYNKNMDSVSKLSHSEKSNMLEDQKSTVSLSVLCDQNKISKHINNKKHTDNVSKISGGETRSFEKGNNKKIQEPQRNIMSNNACYDKNNLTKQKMSNICQMKKNEQKNTKKEKKTSNLFIVIVSILKNKINNYLVYQIMLLCLSVRMMLCLPTDALLCLSAKKLLCL